MCVCVVFSWYFQQYQQDNFSSTRPSRLSTANVRLTSFTVMRVSHLMAIVEPETIQLLQDLKRIDGALGSDPTGMILMLKDLYVLLVSFNSSGTYGFNNIDDRRLHECISILRLWEQQRAVIARVSPPSTSTLEVTRQHFTNETMKNLTRALAGFCLFLDQESRVTQLDGTVNVNPRYSFPTTDRCVTTSRR